jgi:flagellar export protein FliJ
VKKFEFSLDQLLRVKRQLERLAGMEQARARQDADRAHARLQDLRSQLTRVSEQLNASVGRSLTPMQWVSVCDMSDRLGQSIRTSEQEVTETEQKFQAATLERNQIATEVEALDNLRQQQLAQWRQGVEKADQERLDDLGMRRWQAARDDSTGGAPSPA